MHKYLFYLITTKIKHCRQPLSFLSFFHENQYSNDDAVLDNTVEEDQLLLRAGAYTMPQFCEYCGSHDTKECSPSKCTRPKLYFQKKRPPFMKPDPHVWDPMTDHYIEPKRQQLQQSDHRRNDDSVTIEIDNNNKGRPISPLLVPVTTNSWVSGLFHPPQSV